jgi:hypothetical protein
VLCFSHADRQPPHESRLTSRQPSSTLLIHALQAPPRPPRTPTAHELLSQSPVDSSSAFLSVTMHALFEATCLTLPQPCLLLHYCTGTCFPTALVRSRLAPHLPCLDNGTILTFYFGKGCLIVSTSSPASQPSTLIFPALHQSSATNRLSLSV